MFNSSIVACNCSLASPSSLAACNSSLSVSASSIAACVCLALRSGRCRSSPAGRHWRAPAPAWPPARAIGLHQMFHLPGVAGHGGLGLLPGGGQIGVALLQLGVLPGQPHVRRSSANGDRLGQLGFLSHRGNSPGATHANMSTARSGLGHPLSGRIRAAWTASHFPHYTPLRVGTIHRRDGMIGRGWGHIGPWSLCDNPPQEGKPPPFLAGTSHQNGGYHRCAPPPGVLQ